MATVSAKITSGEHEGKSVTVDYDFGSNMQEAIDKFGEEICFTHVRGSLTVALQGWLRSQLAQGKSEAEITEAAGKWLPGQRKQGKSPMEKLREQLDKMSAEDKAAFLKDLKSAK